MGKLRLSKWLGLYALLPLMIALMVIDFDAAMPQTWQLILLAAIAVAVCALALSWVDRHPRLVERSHAGTIDSGDVVPATRVARRLHVAVEDEWESVPIRHSGMDE
jgi:membrane protein implicated in regulation of membrane protease activity